MLTYCGAIWQYRNSTKNRQKEKRKKTGHRLFRPVTAYLLVEPMLA